MATPMRRSSCAYKTRRGKTSGRTPKSRAPNEAKLGRKARGEDAVHPPETRAPTDTPMNVREVADYLGVSDDVARSLLRSRKIKAFKAGGQWRVWRRDLLDFVMTQLQQP